MRGVSLDEIAESTKIGTRLLKALEDEQFDLLPGGIFNKGFVRAYARYLGMDEEQAVADYLQAAGDGEPDVQLLAQPNDRPEPRYSEAPGSGGRGFPFLPVLLLLVVVFAGFGGWKLYQQHMQERESWRAARETAATSESPSVAPQSESSGAAPTSSQIQSSSNGAKTQASPTVAQPSSAAPGNTSAAAASGFEVEVKTTGRAWVSLKADGKILVRGVLDAGQVKTLRADHEILVWTGNAGVTAVSFDGKPVPVEGGVNEPRVLVFKPNGLQPSPPPTVHPANQSPTQPTAQPSPSPQ